MSQPLSVVILLVVCDLTKFSDNWKNSVGLACATQIFTSIFLGVDVRNKNFHCVYVVIVVAM